VRYNARAVRLLRAGSSSYPRSAMRRFKARACESLVASRGQQRMERGLELSDLSSINGFGLQQARGLLQAVGVNHGILIEACPCLPPRGASRFRGSMPSWRPHPRVASPPMASCSSRLAGSAGLRLGRPASVGWSLRSFSPFGPLQPVPWHRGRQRPRPDSGMSLQPRTASDWIQRELPDR